MYRKKLNPYEELLDLDYYYLNDSLESIHKALQSVDDNNFSLYRYLLAQNKFLIKEVKVLEEKLSLMDQKLNFLLDHSKK